VAKKDKPEVAYGLMRTPAGWSVARFLIDGNKVVEKKLSEPDLRSIALEQFIRDTSEFWDDPIDD